VGGGTKQEGSGGLQENEAEKYLCAAV
jgi:hypothetical protein